MESFWLTFAKSGQAVFDGWEAVFFHPFNLWLFTSLAIVNVIIPFVVQLAQKRVDRKDRALKVLWQAVNGFAEVQNQLLSSVKVAELSSRDLTRLLENVVHEVNLVMTEQYEGLWKTTLFPIVDNRIAHEDTWVVLPRIGHTELSADDLNDDRSAVRQCLRRRDMILIPDIEAAIDIKPQKFFKKNKSMNCSWKEVGSEAYNRGSALLLPIIMHSQPDVIGVICLHFKTRVAFGDELELKNWMEKVVRPLYGFFAIDGIARGIRRARNVQEEN